MSDLDALIGDIRQRHARHARRAEQSDVAGFAAHEDRASLLAIVEQLTEELAESRAAYDAVCRSVGASLRRPMQHGADPEPLTLDGGAA
jgi:hypothetical protein